MDVLLPVLISNGYTIIHLLQIIVEEKGYVSIRAKVIQEGYVLELVFNKLFFNLKISYNNKFVRGLIEYRDPRIVSSDTIDREDQYSYLLVYSSSFYSSVFGSFLIVLISILAASYTLYSIFILNFILFAISSHAVIRDL